MELNLQSATLFHHVQAEENYLLGFYILHRIVTLHKNMWSFNRFYFPYNEAKTGEKPFRIQRPKFEAAVDSNCSACWRCMVTVTASQMCINSSIHEDKLEQRHQKFNPEARMVFSAARALRVTYYKAKWEYRELNESVVKCSWVKVRWEEVKCR